jgi:hypothetical protein
MSFRCKLELKTSRQELWTAWQLTRFLTLCFCSTSNHAAFWNKPWFRWSPSRERHFILHRKFNGIFVRRWRNDSGVLKLLTCAEMYIVGGISYVDQYILQPSWHLQLRAATEICCDLKHFKHGMAPMSDHWAGSMFGYGSFLQSFSLGAQLCASPNYGSNRSTPRAAWTETGFHLAKRSMITANFLFVYFSFTFRQLCNACEQNLSFISTKCRWLSGFSSTLQHELT